MIRTIYVGNFKGIGETQPIPIRPITLVFGPNSAGKSSVLHSFLLAHQAISESDLSPIHTRIGGSIDLGGFQQFVHGHRALERVTWGAEHGAESFTPAEQGLFGIRESAGLQVRFGYDLASESEPVRKSERTGFLPQDAHGRRDLKAIAGPHAQEIVVKVDGQPLLELGLCPGGHLAPRRLDVHGPSVTAVAEAIGVTRSRMDLFRSYLIGLMDSVRVETSSVLPVIAYLLRGPDRLASEVLSAYKRGLRQFHVKNRGGWKALALGMGLLEELPPGIHRRKKERALVEAVACWDCLCFLLLEEANRIKTDVLTLRYLGPLRKLPPRTFVTEDIESGDPDYLSSGTAAWGTVHRNRSLRERLNKWLNSESLLATRYKLVIEQRFLAQTVRHFIRTADVEASRKLSADELARALHRSESSTETHTQSLRIKDCRTGTIVDHTDVGTGISQVLPVLVETMGNSNSLLVMEQPELHLHPRLQAELMDVLLQSALGRNRNTLVVETHSEHMILRALRRIRQSAEGKLKLDGVAAVVPDDVSVLYVRPLEEGGVQVHELQLDSEGRFIGDWPDGFFPERLQELE